MSKIDGWPTTLASFETLKDRIAEIAGHRSSVLQLCKGADRMFAEHGATAQQEEAVSAAAKAETNLSRELDAFGEEFESFVGDLKAHSRFQAFRVAHPLMWRTAKWLANETKEFGATALGAAVA